MFYSHTFLAKKSPMGTVWIAAHLERRIKKHDVEKVDIPTYADTIIFPEVPIAMRIQGHLLYGLVKIYSMKVDYFIQYCYRMRDDYMGKGAFPTTGQVNLPSNAEHASFESVTLPSTFNLDSLDLEFSQIETPDKHLRSYNEITLPDYIAFEGEQYVSILINEDNSNSPPPFDSNTNLGPVPMELELPPFEDICDFDASTINLETDRTPNNQADTSVHSHNEGPIENVVVNTDHDSNNQTESPEVLRDAIHTSGLDKGIIIENFNETPEISIPSSSRNVNLSPIMEVASGGNSSSSPVRVTSPRAADIPNTPFSFEHRSPDVQVQPSPPVNQNIGRKRNRKQAFDQTIVLTNAKMKAQLSDTSQLVCKRRKLPCSVLDVWRFNKMHRNEQILHGPLLSGMSAELQEVSERRIPSLSESTSFEPSLGHMDASEPENIRSTTDANEMIQDDMHPSPVREESTPHIANNLGPESEKRKTIEPELEPTIEFTASANHIYPDFDTPSVIFEEPFLDDSNSRAVPSLQNSADIEELTFLETSNPSSGSDVTELGTMSTRTRKVAQYLNGLSPIAYTPEDQSAAPPGNTSGWLSLNKILERKTRKQCARMFFEMLVLKSYELIDVQQEEAYGDILISRTHQLSSIKF